MKCHERAEKTTETLTQAEFVSEIFCFSLLPVSGFRWWLKRETFTECTMIVLRVPLPSFLAFPDLENGKSDWAQIFTIDRARKIRGHVFERFVFLDFFILFFYQKQISVFSIVTRVLVWRSGPIELKFLPEVVTTLTPGCFFCLKKSSTLQFLSLENTVKFSRELVFLHENLYNFWRRG